MNDADLAVEPSTARPVLHVVELIVVTSMVINPLIVSFTHLPDRVVIAAMGGLPVVVAVGVYAVFEDIRRQQLWFVGIGTALGFSLAAAILLSNGVESPAVLLVVWAGTVALMAFVGSRLF